MFGFLVSREPGHSRNVDQGAHYGPVGHSDGRGMDLGRGGVSIAAPSLYVDAGKWMVPRELRAMQPYYHTTITASHNGLI